jgi:hypothetical protein
VSFASPVVTGDETWELVKEVRLPFDASYFFKPDPNGEWVTFATIKVNHLYRLDTLVDRIIPGEVDPVPTPDGKYLTAPAPLRFFALDRILSVPNPVHEAPAFTDDLFRDQYQSIGILSPGHYRVLAGWANAPQFRDYVDSEKGLTPSGGLKYLCPRVNGSLPIIAKDGKAIALRDNSAGKSRVYAIGDGGDRCDVKWDLGVSTGKLAFGFDGERIAFSAATVQTGAVGRFRDPGSLAFLDAYVCRTGRLACTRLTDNAAKSDRSFPEFFENGDVIYMTGRNGSRDRLLRVVRLVP